MPRAPRRRTELILRILSNSGSTPFHATSQVMRAVVLGIFGDLAVLSQVASGQPYANLPEVRPVLHVMHRFPRLLEGKHAVDHRTRLGSRNRPVHVLEHLARSHEYALH